MKNIVEAELDTLRAERDAADYEFSVREKALREQLPCAPDCELCSAEGL